MTKKPGYFDTQNFRSDELFFAEHLVMKHPFPLHRHTFAELQFFTDGQGIEIINGISYPLQKGSFSLKMPWHTHEIIPDANMPLHYYKCGFRIGNLDEGGLLHCLNGTLAENFKLNPFILLPDEQQDTAISIYEIILREKSGINIMKNEMIAAQIIQLVVLFIRHIAAANDKSAKQPTQHLSTEIIHLMNLRYHEPDLTLSDIADFTNADKKRVTEVLNEHTGLSFGELLREIRIRNACRFLQNSSYPVETISELVGYRSRSAFYNIFKENTGVSPSEYRKHYAFMDEGTNINILSNSKMYHQIVYYLLEHYMEKITPDTLARCFHCNTDALSILLSHHKTSFKTLLNEIRIYHARQLLLFSDNTIESIGRMVGYLAPETFYRAFKKHTGCTPKNYKKNQSHEIMIEQNHFLEK